jgi:hypothetical protein
VAVASNGGETVSIFLDGETDVDRPNTAGMSHSNWLASAGIVQLPHNSSKMARM